MIQNNLIQKNEEYLKNFTFAGEFHLENITKKIEFKKSEKLPHDKKGIYAICSNRIVKFFGDCFGEGILARLNCYSTGGSSTNTTYQRIHKRIEEQLYDQQKITVYFFECNEIEANKKINRYQKIFGKGAKPEWVKHIKNTKIGFSQQLENLLSDHTQLSLSAKKCREEEIISNDQLHIDIKEFTRKYPEKIKAIKNSKNKCALEILNRHCIYFERRNKIINIPNERYLEVHHLIPLSSTIPNSSFECLDKYENMVCLCGNCHNQIHYGMEKDVELILKNLYELKERELKKVGLNIGIKKLISIYKEL